jgi:hypothetical protein
MIRHPDGHVSLLVHFPPQDVREVARGLSSLLDGIEDVSLTLDLQRGNLELGNVRGVDLRLLTEWLYRRGARGVFVRYPHEGWSEPADVAVTAPAFN